MSQIKKSHHIKTNNIKKKSPFEQFEYCNALFEVKYIYVDKILSEVLKFNDADNELLINDDHIKTSGIGYA